MNDHDEGSLSLGDVSARFLDAEAKLQDLAGAAEALTAETTQLAEARQSVHGLASQLAGFTTTLQSLVEDLRVATQTIQKTDPATVLTRLDWVGSTLSSTSNQLDAINTSTQTNVKSVIQLEQQMVAANKRVRTLVLVAIAVATVAAVLSGLALAM